MRGAIHDVSRLTLSDPSWDRVNVEIVFTRSADCDNRGEGFISRSELVCARTAPRPSTCRTARILLAPRPRPERPAAGAWSGWTAPRCSPAKASIPRSRRPSPYRLRLRRLPARALDGLHPWREGYAGLRDAVSWPPNFRVKPPEEPPMKVINAIANVLKKEGVEWLIGYPVNPIIEGAAEADIRTIMVRQERIGLHMCRRDQRRPHLGRQDRRLRDAARARAPKTPLAASRNPTATRFRWLCCRPAMPATSTRFTPNFNAAAEFPPRYQIMRAGHSCPTRRSRRCAVLSRSVKERPSRPGAGRVPDRHSARRSAGRAGRRIQGGAAPGGAPPTRNRCRRVAEALVAAERPVPPCRAGRALRQGLAAVEGTGRTA